MLQRVNQCHKATFIVNAVVKKIIRRPSNIILEKPKYFSERTSYESQTKQLRWKPFQIGVLTQQFPCIGLIFNSLISIKRQN